MDETLIRSAVNDLNVAIVMPKTIVVFILTFDWIIWSLTASLLCVIDVLHKQKKVITTAAAAVAAVLIQWQWPKVLCTHRKWFHVFFSFALLWSNCFNWCVMNVYTSKLETRFIYNTNKSYLMTKWKWANAWVHSTHYTRSTEARSVFFAVFLLISLTRWSNKLW